MRARSARCHVHALAAISAAGTWLVPCAGGAFSDGFGGYDVHAYRIAH